jgi:NADPH:quinone reductase-like Zn-dependent oxidoreductase
MRTNRIITTPLAALLGAAALAGPAAAVPADPVSTGPPSPAAPPPIVQPVAPVDARSSGFDWGSVGIGAAGGVGAFAITLAGATGMRRRRLARPRSIATR